jgi:hypothetical protein
MLSIGTSDLPDLLFEADASGTQIGDYHGYHYA